MTHTEADYFQQFIGLEDGDFKIAGKIDYSVDIAYDIRNCLSSNEVWVMTYTPIYSSDSEWDGEKYLVGFDEEEISGFLITYAFLVLKKKYRIVEWIKSNACIIRVIKP